MTFRRICWWLMAVLLILSACKSSQTAVEPGDGSETDPMAAQLDTAAGFNEPILAVGEIDEEAPPPLWAPRQGPYRPAPERLFEIHDTRLDLRFDWKEESVIGTATLTLSPLFYAQDSLTLDAQGFDLKSVALLGLGQAKPLQYQYEDSLRLRIKLDKPYARSDKLKLRVEYLAQPTRFRIADAGTEGLAQQGLFFVDPADEDPNKPSQIWTQGQTGAVSRWYPTFDQPNAFTARQEIKLTVLDKYETVANGRLLARQVNPDGTRTDHWVQDQPLPVSRCALAVGPFSVVRQEWQGKPLLYYVQPEYEEDAKAVFARTGEMIDFFSEKYGAPFAWDKYAQVALADFSFGTAENASASFFMDAVQVDARFLIDDSMEPLMAHALSHQWFGNLVGYESYAHLPLSTAFASYAEYLWTEHAYGRDEAELTWLEDFEYYLAEAERKREPIIRYNYVSEDDLYDRHSYAKGAMALHQLRRICGDEAFFASLGRFLNDNRHQAAEIGDLREAFEETTGQDWRWYFEQWFLQPGHPELYVRESYYEGELTLSILQAQDERYIPYYRLPLYVDVWTGGKRTRHAIEVQPLKDQQIVLKVAQKPDLVLFDADNRLPGLVEHLKTTEAFILQYREAEHMLSRRDALTQLRTGILDEPEARQILLEAFEADFWGERYYAVTQFVEYRGDNRQKIGRKIEKLALEDPRSLVRAQAVNALATFADTSNGYFAKTFERAMQDSSYAVLANALRAYYVFTEDENPGQKVAQYEAIDHPSIVFTLANIYAANRVGGKADWFARKTRKQSGKGLEYMINALVNYAVNIEDEAEKRACALIFKDLAQNHFDYKIRIVTYEMLSVLSDAGLDMQADLLEIRKGERNPKVQAAHAEMSGPLESHEAAVDSPQDRP